MRRVLQELLADPRSGAPLELEVDAQDAQGNVLEGRLRGARGGVYPIRRGIPRFVSTTDPDQLSTEATFGYKWQRTESYGSPGMRAEAQRWLAARYGFADIEG